jgi:hypothetical protein
MTGYESKAQELLAKRGAQAEPKPLVEDLAEMLEWAHEDGRRLGLFLVKRVLRDTVRSFASMIKEIEAFEAQGSPPQRSPRSPTGAPPVSNNGY